MYINSVISHLKFMVIYGCFPQLSILYIATIIKAESIINDCYIFNVLFGVYISVKVSGC